MRSNGLEGNQDLLQINLLGDEQVNVAEIRKGLDLTDYLQLGLH